MIGELKDVLDKMDILSQKIGILTSVVALNKQIDKILEGKNQTQQIQTLSQWKLPREIIAAFIGTTPETVRVSLSGAKSKKKKQKSLE